MDDLVAQALENLFPGHLKPDEHSFMANGDQHKAPDHSILDGAVLIERKSRNVSDDGQFYEKLKLIAGAQGKSFRAYGRINVAGVISNLPDPQRAAGELQDYFNNAILKSVKNARQKFSEYAKHVPCQHSVRLLIISDNSEIHSNDGTFVQFLGRRMGGYDITEDVTGPIDSIIFIRRPDRTMTIGRSHWFNCLIKGRLNTASRETIRAVAMQLFQCLQGSFLNGDNSAASVWPQPRVLIVGNEPSKTG